MKWVGLIAVLVLAGCQSAPPPNGYVPGSAAAEGMMRMGQQMQQPLRYSKQPIRCTSTQYAPNLPVETVCN